MPDSPERRKVDRLTQDAEQASDRDGITITNPAEAEDTQ